MDSRLELCFALEAVEAAEEAAPDTPRFTGDAARAFLHLLAFALNASTDSRPDDALTPDLLNVRRLGVYLSRFVQRQTRRYGAALTPRPVELSPDMVKLNAVLDKINWHAMREAGYFRGLSNEVVKC